MAARKSDGIAPEVMQRVKVLSKLYESGCKNEKELQALSMESLLKIPDISVDDMRIIIEVQKQTKANKLFSYLGGGTYEPTEQGS